MHCEPATRSPALIHLLKGTEDQTEGSTDLEESQQEDISFGGGERVVCAICEADITHEKYRRESREYSFANPAGLLFHIRCYHFAPGIVHHGEPTSVFSWFPGYAWNHAHCRNCAAHLGWRFTSGEGLFFGLVVDRIKICTDESAAGGGDN